MDQLITWVVANNPELKASIWSQAAARAGVSSAQAFQNPRLEWSQGSNSARTISASPGPVQAWAVSQFIENPTLRGARIDSARALEKDSEHQARITRNELVAQVRLRAYQGLLFQAQSAAAADAGLFLSRAACRATSSPSSRPRGARAAA